MTGEQLKFIRTTFMLNVREMSKLLLVGEEALRKWEETPKLPVQIERYVISVLHECNSDVSRRRIIEKNKFRIEYELLKELGMLTETFTTKDLVKKLLDIYKNLELIELFTGISKERLKNLLAGAGYKHLPAKRMDVLMLMLLLADVTKEIKPKTTKGERNAKIKTED